jgi:DNA-binding IclR family transcriptional regulator
MSKSGTVQSAEKVLAVLDVLMRNFAHGFTPGDLAKATGVAAPDITRYVATLEKAGFAERIPETGRIRPSHRHAQYAFQIMKSLSDAGKRFEESTHRIEKGAA